MNVKITGKTGKEYEVRNIEQTFKEFMAQIALCRAGGAFLVFNDIAIEAQSVESVTII